MENQMEARNKIYLGTGLLGLGMIEKRQLANCYITDFKKL